MILILIANIGHLFRELLFMYSDNTIIICIQYWDTLIKKIYFRNTLRIDYIRNVLCGNTGFIILFKNKGYLKRNNSYKKSPIQLRNNENLIELGNKRDILINNNREQLLIYLFPAFYFTY